MITQKQTLFLVVCLTLALLAACEPLAPEQTPQYIVVTGETAAPSAPTSAAAFVGTLPATSANSAGVVNTPSPSETSLPTETAIPSATPMSCDETAGQVLRSSFSSTIAGGDVNFLMYLPPCFYDTFQRYPYVILLHGTGYDETMWEQLGVITDMDQGITKGTLPPMVLIMPDGGYAFELNDEPNDTSYESILLNELIPTVETEFCLWGNREGRAIGGISRGGFWAFSVALRHPDTFSILGGHSPYFEDDNAAPDVNPLNLAATVNLDKFPLRIYMDNGASDIVGANAARLSEILQGRGIEHEYLTNPTGDHDMSYWQSHVSEYLSFYGETWPRDVSDLPSCLEPSP
jgi:enterochelin esterase-like enzyme